MTVYICFGNFGEIKKVFLHKADAQAYSRIELVDISPIEVENPYPSKDDPLNDPSKASQS